MEQAQDILRQLKRIADAMTVSKAPAIWQIDDIAAWLKKSPGHTRDRVVKLQGFPEPIPTGGWFSDEIIEWARLNRGRMKTY